MNRLLWLVALLALLPGVTTAQSDYGQRIPSRDGRCLAPVASRLIGSNERDHVGRGSVAAWDWSASVGSPIFPICPGVVSEASSSNRGGYGWFVIIDHGNGISALYAHCLQNSFRVKTGDRVDHWTQLCQVGLTGITSWSHVHLEIYQDGTRRPITNYFDPALVHYCHFTKCVAQNKPDDPIARDSRHWATPQSPGVTPNALQRILATVTAEQFATLVTALVSGVMLAWWLFGLYVRVGIVAATTAAITALFIALLFLPSAPGQAGQQAARGAGDWQKAYQVTQGREGWKCTNDGAYTMGGVTQGTYNRWRAKHGMGPADVCRSLTREQAKAIFYEMFWQPIGADRLPFALALSAVDHYYNTGKVSHLLAQCGQDVGCFNQARIADYKTKSNCYLYCVAWINRVNHIRKLTEVIK